MVNLNELDRKDMILYLHGASAFQLLHAGIELNIFKYLNNHKSMSLEEITKYIKLMPQPVRTLMFGLTALGLVLKSNDKYNNCNMIEEMFRTKEYGLFKKMTLIQAHIMYLGQADYVKSLKQNKNVGVERYSGNGKTIYERIKDNQKLKNTFYDYMEAYSAYALPHLLKRLDLSEVKSVLDVGGGGGNNAITIAKKYPHLKVNLFDITTAKSTALKKIESNHMKDRIVFYEGDMFKDEFPNNQDMVMFIHQLVIWGIEENKSLLKKAYNSLKVGGKVIVFSSIANDEENGPLMTGLDTVYFRAVAAGNGMIYPWKDYEKIMLEVGFSKIERHKCDTWTPHGIIIGQK
jgi:ubiquinone/menaquinone biosynthesis C-methylase UbiE